MNPILILLLLSLRATPLTSNYMYEYKYDTSILDGDQDDLSTSKDSASDVDSDEENKDVTHVPKSDNIPQTNSLKKTATKFIELVNRPTYVDKTHMLETLFENRRRSQMNIITSPKGFGKTALMNMIKFFAQIETDPMGSPLEIEKMQCSSVFKNETLNLNVTNSPVLYSFLGHYPVIYLNLKYIIGKNIKTTWRNLQSRIKKLYLEYGWMVKKIKWKYQMKRYDCTVNEKLQNSVIQKIIGNKKVNAEVLEMSLFVFSEALYMHFKRRVLVLIDDFDHPLLEMATHPENDFPRDRVTQVLGNMLDRLLVGIDKLRYVDVALLTGTTHVRLSVTFESYSKLFKFNRFLDGHPYAKYFGFTHKEVKSLFLKNNLRRTDLEMAKKLHNGYVTLNERNRTALYCPQSVISFVSEKLNLSRPFLPLIDNPPLAKFVRILKQDKIRIAISQLLLSKPIMFAIARRLEYEDLEHLGEVLNDKSRFDRDAEQTFFTFLLDHGYLTEAKYPKAKTGVFQVANTESLQGLANFLYEYASNYDQIDLDSTANLFNDIFISDEVSEQMLTSLRKALRKLCPKEENPDSNTYRMHSLIFCTLMKNYLNGTIEVEINSDPDLETDTEIRADIFIVSRKNSRAMIVEIRQDVTAKEALQMAEKNLAKWKTKRKLRIIKYLGLSFKDERKIRIGYKDNVHDSPIIIRKSRKREE